MADISKLPVSIYFTWQWWEKHYQAASGRPDRIDFDWLDRTYLGRQRFLHEAFSEFGIGQEQPTLDVGFVSTMLPFHTIIVPVALGVKTGLKDVGGYHWQNLPEDELRALKPVDIESTWLAETIQQEYDVRFSRYGSVNAMIDLASAANNAFTIRGPQFYEDLIADPELADGYLGVITETMCRAYKFMTDLFGPIEGFPLGNCNVTMMSPGLYIERLRNYDIRCVNYAAKLSGKPPVCDMHHCNVKTEPFAEAYSAIPGIRSLQGSHLSDIVMIRRILPEASFSAMVNPVDLICKPMDQVHLELDASVAEGAHDLAVWDIGPEFGPDQMRGLMRTVTSVAGAHGKQPEFSIVPMSWEELDWEFPRYRQ